MRKFLTVALLFVFILSSFQTSFAAYTPTANGCGPENGPSVPNYWYFWNGFWSGTDTFPFVLACNAHDICYGTLGMSQSTCDTNFLNNLLSICNRYGTTWASRTYCSGLAYTYYGAVATFGGWAYDAAQAKARAG
jgi:hypothetical protein